MVPQYYMKDWPRDLVVEVWPCRQGTAVIYSVGERLCMDGSRLPMRSVAVTCDFNTRWLVALWLDCPCDVRTVATCPCTPTTEQRTFT